MKMWYFGKSMKTCVKCNTKEAALRYIGKTCYTCYRKTYVEGRKEKIRAQRKANYDAHRGERKASRIAYYRAHKEEELARQKNYRDAHREEIRDYARAHKGERKAYHKAYNQAHKEQKRAWHKANDHMRKEERKAYRKVYRQENKEKIREYNKAYDRDYTRKRRTVDIQFKIRLNLRSRLHAVLKGKIKVGSAVTDLGCSVEDLKKHLESQFSPGMSWENYGNKEGQWSIDHIFPLSKADLTDKEQFLKVCHYTNLQPLWHLDNMRKGNKV